VEAFGHRVRLCLKDLYPQDIVEMIERETRRYEFIEITHPDHPDFARAYGLLWNVFGPPGEMEPEHAIRRFLLDDPWDPLPSGTFIRYFLIVAKDRDGNLRGVRDGSVMYNPAWSPDLCTVYLSHIYVLPEARGTVLTYWLRIAPVELAIEYLHQLQQRGLVTLPQPDAPGRYFGVQLNLAAEMEYFSPDDRLSLQRILFYGRGGFDVIDPRHFPYRQPDFRSPAVIEASGNRPVPFMLLVRRMGRERQARLPIEEASVTMRHLYDEFACFCTPEFLQNSLDLVLARLEERRAKGRPDVALLPLPTGPRNLGRLRKLFRHDNYRRHYAGAPGTEDYMERMNALLAADPGWFDRRVAELGEELAAHPHYVYGSRDKQYEVDAIPALAADADETAASAAQDSAEADAAADD
jgi:GNAT superfamily N-acetyltransferase